MDSTDLSSFKKLFLTTAREHLQTMRSSLRSLSQNMQEKDAMNRIYIAAHSFKGESLAIGFMSSAALAQLIEKVFHAAREGSLILTAPLLESVRVSVDKLSESIDSIEKEDKECVLNEERLALGKLSGISLNS